MTRLTGPRLAVAAACVWLAIWPAAAQQPPPGPNAPGPLPLDGLTIAERQAFDEGNRAFRHSFSVAEGLGPVFNDESCADCHRNGGDSNRNVTRFGRLVRDQFDPITERGGSLVQSRGIGNVTMNGGSFTFDGERPPGEASIRAQRRSPSLLGLGLVDAVSPDTLLEIAAAERASDPSTAGRVHLVIDQATGETTAGRFGWKAQVGTLRDFAGDALLNEMGITSPGFRDEVCPQGNCDALTFNPTPALNDDGREAEAIALFMRLLAPPRRGPPDPAAGSGELAFNEIGCGSCHRSEMSTGPNTIRPLDRVTFRPYSDFLLHDMGSLGDGIAQGQASGRDMRTAPLWGAGTAGRFLHDGSANSLEDAIRRHDGQARGARERFEQLGAERVAALIAFLRSL